MNLPSSTKLNKRLFYEQSDFQKIEVYDAIENLFWHDNFHYNTTQAGEILEVEN